MIKVDESQALLVMRDIVEAVAQRTGVTVARMRGREKNPGCARPRHIAMYLARMMTSASFPEIGRFFGGRDHSTVFTAFKKIEGLIAVEKPLGDLIDSLSLEVGNGLVGPASPVAAREHAN